MTEPTNIVNMKGVAEDFACEKFADGEWVGSSTRVPLEKEITVRVNLKELVNIMCTPTKINFLILGFLYSEGIISGLDDVLMMNVCDEESEVDVRLTNPGFQLPTRRRLTSGCGGGAAFAVAGQRVDSDLVVTPKEISSLMKQFQERIDLYQVSGGIHASALADTERVLAVAMDIGRHNSVDKIQGESLLTGMATKDRLLLTTGRVSSEMLLKAAKMQAPVVVSRHSPTSAAVALARELGIGLAGHARGNRLTVYSHPERFGRAGNSVEEDGTGALKGG